MATLLIVYWSRTGGSRQMAEAAAGAAAAAAPATAVRLVAAPEAGPPDLLEASGYLFACPENLASMAGMMKEFFDRCYYPVLDRIAGRPYGCMVCAGSDGTGAVRQLERIATGWRLAAIAPAIIVNTGAQSPEAIAAPKRIDAADLARCAELGATLAAGVEMGIY
jgi:multimeric flavodoxin WrbA